MAGVDRVDRRGHRLLLLGDLVGEALAGGLRIEPRGDVHRDDHPHRGVIGGEPQRPGQGGGSVVAPVEADHDAAAGRALVPTCGHHHDRRGGMRGAVPADRPEPVLTQLAGALLADDQELGADRSIDEYVRRLTLDDHRCHTIAHAELVDDDVELVTGGRRQTQLVDPESTLGGEQRHHRRHVERRHRGDRDVPGHGVVQGEAKGVDGGIRSVDADNPAIGHTCEYRSPTGRPPLPNDPKCISLTFDPANIPYARRR